MKPRTAARSYTRSHAAAGVKAALPDIECWENQYPASGEARPNSGRPGYEIDLSFPEFTSVCPKTGLPDFGTIRIRYGPGPWCLETKSLKLYLNAFRDLGIFTENAVNRILKDVVRCAKPKWAVVEGRFSARGGIEARIEARHGKVPFSRRQG